MPSYPTKVRVVQWGTGDPGLPGDVYVYDAATDLFYNRGQPLSSDPLLFVDGEWRTRLGTTLCVLEGTITREATAFKADTGKSRWTLLLDCAEGCGRAVRAVVRVLNFAVRPVADGGKGYIPHSWRQVPDARTRYEDALHRHLDAIRDGETHDAESGESHWAHVATNALFLWELNNPKEKTDE